MTSTDRPADMIVRRALDAVLSSEAFARSERLRSFLSHVVECELAGQAAQLKGYSIGIDVFGRPAGFDAGNDPLVRVQAGKLRKLLDLYYETEGAEDCIRIRIPLGSYVPAYTVREHHDPASPSPCDQFAAASRQPKRRRSGWLPAPVSSPLAMLSLLPLLFLAPIAYPGTISSGIANAELLLAVQNKLTGLGEALPQVQVLGCWPSGAECSAVAEAVTRTAGYYRTIRLVTGTVADIVQPLSYSVRIDSRPGEKALFLRVVHDEDGQTIYARRILREQIRTPDSLAYEAVTFGMRVFAANGVLYRHAARSGATTDLMRCLAETQPAAGSDMPAPCPDPRQPIMTNAAAVRVHPATERTAIR